MDHSKKILFYLSLILLFSACKKEEFADPLKNNLPAIDRNFEVETPVKERFFNDYYILQNNSNLQIAAQSRDQQAILNDLQYVIDYQDDKENFIADLVDEIGYPVWSEADVMDPMIFVPFVKEESEAVEAILVVKVEGKNYDFKLLLRDRIYNNILAENIHPNFDLELYAFYEYDMRLFGVEDDLIVQALQTDYEAESNYRCATYVHEWCNAWAKRPIVFKEEKEAQTRGCGEYCIDCEITVYIDCAPISNNGWGNTGSQPHGDFPPLPNGGSQYVGGSGNDSGEGGENPDNWWEEKAYDNVSLSLIKDLEMGEEDAELLECMAKRSTFKARVRQVTDNVNKEDPFIRNAIVQAISFACVCDDFSPMGKEQCDEIAMFEEALMQEVTDCKEWSTGPGANCEFKNPCGTSTSSFGVFLDVLKEISDYSSSSFVDEYTNQLSKCEEGLGLLMLVDDPILANKTCKGSFNYIKVGLGFTAQVNDIFQSYRSNQAGFFFYRIGVMCIQVRGKDAFNQPLTAEKAAELSAYAMDNARLELFKELGLTIHTNIEARLAYKDYIVKELKILTGQGATSSISYETCGGSVPSEEYRVNPMGIPLCLNFF